MLTRSIFAAVRLACSTWSATPTKKTTLQQARWPVAVLSHSLAPTQSDRPRLCICLVIRQCTSLSLPTTLQECLSIIGSRSVIGGSLLTRQRTLLLLETTYKSVWTSSAHGLCDRCQSASLPLSHSVSWDCPVPAINARMERRALTHTCVSLCPSLYPLWACGFWIF